MARTILDIAREAAERNNTAQAPTVLFGTNDRNARILRVAAKDTIRDYLRSSTWLGLSEFLSQWVLVLKPGRFAYPLPPDFLRMIPDTGSRLGGSVDLIGPASPDVWSRWIGGGTTRATGYGWHIQNGAILISPTPAVEEIVTITYISRFPVVAALQPGDLDTQTPPQVLAPAVQRDGFMDGQASRVIYESETGFAYGTGPGWDAGVWATSLSEMLGRINPLSVIAPVPQVRREEFTADTDKPAFEDDYLLSLGMTWRLRKALGADYAEEVAAYEAEAEMKLGTDGGFNSIIPLGSGDYGDEVAPLGSGRWRVN